MAEFVGTAFLTLTVVLSGGQDQGYIGIGAILVRAWLRGAPP